MKVNAFSMPNARAWHQRSTFASISRNILIQKIVAIVDNPFLPGTTCSYVYTARIVEYTPPFDVAVSHKLTSFRTDFVCVPLDQAQSTSFVGTFLLPMALSITTLASNFVFACQCMVSLHQTFFTPYVGYVFIPLNSRRL